MSEGEMICYSFVGERARPGCFSRRRCGPELACLRIRVAADYSRPGADEGPIVHVMAAVSADRILKSPHRVKTYGEVLTPSRMVNRMLDLVSAELEEAPGFVDTTFFEPAAGDGNFLVAILRRKLLAVEARYPREAWSTEALHALASVYAVELLEDNHRDAQRNMLREFVGFHEEREIICMPDAHLYRAASFLIKLNIVRGDTLRATTSEGDDITLSWWTRLENAPGMVQREPFTLSSLQSGGFDFSTHAQYGPCRIDRVHEQEHGDDQP